MIIIFLSLLLSAFPVYAMTLWELEEELHEARAIVYGEDDKVDKALAGLHVQRECVKKRALTGTDKDFDKLLDYDNYTDRQVSTLFAELDTPQMQFYVGLLGSCKEKKRRVASFPQVTKQCSFFVNAQPSNFSKLSPESYRFQVSN
jgi:hypothetical protein